MAAEVLRTHALVAGYLPGVDIVRGVDVCRRRRDGRRRRSQRRRQVDPDQVPVRTGKTRMGSIVLNGDDITGSPAHRITRRGVGYMPQRENVFARMTVEENLELGAMALRLDLAHEKERAFTLFPRLRERRRQPAGVLSGGERQMLALARAVISNPHLLLLDEPSAGVDPGMVEILWQKIAAVNAAGATILMVEQNARQALRCATAATCSTSARPATRDADRSSSPTPPSPSSIWAAARRRPAGATGRPLRREGPGVTAEPSPGQPPTKDRIDD